MNEVKFKENIRVVIIQELKEIYILDYEKQKVYKCSGRIYEYIYNQMKNIEISNDEEIEYVLREKGFLE